MKKLFMLLLSACLFTAISLADVGKLPERTVENVADGVIVTYTFGDADIRPNHLVPGSYIWEYSGFGVNDTPGEPAIPRHSDMFYIPSGHKTRVTLLNATYKDTTLVISPAIPNPPDDGTSIVIDSIIPYSGFFPDNVMEYDSLQNYRSVGLQNISIAPVRYNYSQHKVRAYTEIKYKVTFVPDNVRNGSKDTTLSGMSDLTSTFLSNITLNYNPTLIRSNSTWHSTPNECKYVILTTNEYGNAIQDFVKWKCMTGYNVHTITKNKGNWTKEDVISIVDSMNAHYLLIVGGHDDVPAVPFIYRYSKRDTLGNPIIVTVNAATDYDYGRPTPTGVPQNFHGRIPADNAQQVTTIFNKIIQYEKEPIIDNGFYQTGLNCAEFQDSDNDSIDGYEDRCFLMTSENIRNHVLRQGFQVHRQYVKNSSVTPMHWSRRYSNGALLPPELQPDSFMWDGNSDSIASYINNGVFFVLHRDHGSINGWSHPPYNTDDVNQLQNGTKLPVVFSLNCKTGKYDSPGDCFAEAFLKNANGGCAGIFAATETSFSGYNDVMALAMFDAIWPNLSPDYHFNYYAENSNPQTPIYDLGQILSQSLIRMNSLYKSSNTAMITQRLFHCFGDPSMRIYTDTPHIFAEPLIFSRGDSLFVFVEDGDCTITFYDKVTHGIKSYNGNYAGYANPSDNLVICLDRHNYVPYIWDYEKDLYIQNEDIQNETRVYKGNTIYVGNNVTSTKPSGNVNIQNSNITIQGKRLELHSGTQIDKNFKFQNR